MIPQQPGACLDILNSPRPQSFLHTLTDEEMKMYLHEAISQILKAEDNCGLTATEIAALNKAKDLYRKRDNDFPNPRQIGRRVNNHGKRNTGWFEPENAANNHSKIFLDSKNPLA